MATQLTNGRRVPSGYDLNTYVREQSGSAGLVVALVTPSCQTPPFCIAELEAARSRSDYLFPLLAPGLDSAWYCCISGCCNSCASSSTAHPISNVPSRTMVATAWGSFHRFETFETPESIEIPLQNLHIFCLEPEASLATRK